MSEIIQLRSEDKTHRILTFTSEIKTRRKFLLCFLILSDVLKEATEKKKAAAFTYSTYGLARSKQGSLTKLILRTNNIPGTRFCVQEELIAFSDYYCQCSQQKYPHIRMRRRKERSPKTELILSVWANMATNYLKEKKYIWTTQFPFWKQTLTDFWQQVLVCIKWVNC